MRVSENKDLAAVRKVHLVLIFIAVSSSCCAGKPQTAKCLIQSYYRRLQGSGKTGIGNLLLVHVQSNAPFAPTRLSFTGSCNDSASYTEFLMHKKIVKGKLIVSFQWNYKQTYVLAIRNRSLVIEHNRNLNHQDEFVLKCVPSKIYCAFTTLIKNDLSSTPEYIRTDDKGKPLVGTNSSDVTTWFTIQCADPKKPTACGLRNS